MKKKIQAHRWDNATPPTKESEYTVVTCLDCGGTMMWYFLSGQPEDFVKMYQWNTRLRSIDYGKPKDRYLMPDCNDEKIRRTHRT